MKRLLILLFFVLNVSAQTYITISDKSTGNTLSAAEFNQILDALKDGTRAIKTTGVTIGSTYYTVFMIPADMRDSIFAYLEDSIGVSVQAYDATLSDIADGTITENLVNTANPWADNEVANDITASNYQPLEATLTDIADGTIAENLVNTANPWADNEVADNITASSYTLLTAARDTVLAVLSHTGETKNLYGTFNLFGSIVLRGASAEIDSVGYMLIDSIRIGSVTIDSLVIDADDSLKIRSRDKWFGIKVISTFTE